MPCPGWALRPRSNLCFRKPRLFGAKASRDGLAVYCILPSRSHSEVRGGLCYHSILTEACSVSCSPTGTRDHGAVRRRLVGTSEEANLETKQNKKLTKAIPASPQDHGI